MDHDSLRSLATALNTRAGFCLNATLGARENFTNIQGMLNRRFTAFPQRGFATDDTLRLGHHRVKRASLSPSNKARRLEFPQREFQQGVSSIHFTCRSSQPRDGHGLRELSVAKRSSLSAPSGQRTGGKPRLIQTKIEAVDRAGPAGGLVHIDQHGVHLHVTFGDNETCG